MSAIATVSPPTPSRRNLAAAFVSAEWIKLRTLRSTTITLSVAAIVSIGIAILSSQRFAHRLSELHGIDRIRFLGGFDPASQSLIGNAFAQLAIAALGVLVVTSEYSTGMIRASLAAMPQRQRWIAAKLAVFAAVVLVIGQALTFASFGAGQALLSGQHVGWSLSHPGALRCVVATGLYLALVGLMAAAIGLVIRHTAGAITTFLGVLFVLPALSNVLPESVRSQVTRFFPETIGEQAATGYQMTGHFSPWVGIALMAGYVVILIATGCVLLQRRDG
jgi:ABC-2 type transport system permease protein